jgi:hypothetical protein
VREPLWRTPLGEPAAVGGCATSAARKDASADSDAHPQPQCCLFTSSLRSRRLPSEQPHAKCNDANGERGDARAEEDDQAVRLCSSRSGRGEEEAGREQDRRHPDTGAGEEVVDAVESGRVREVLRERTSVGTGSPAADREPGAA